jgi:hypothetical protein
MMGLRKIFGPKTDERTENWRRMHSEELSRSVFFAKYFSGDQIEKNERAGHVARMEERRVVYRALARKPEDKRSLVRHRLNWEDNIKIDLK